MMEKENFTIFFFNHLIRLSLVIIINQNILWSQRFDVPALFWHRLWYCVPVNVLVIIKEMFVCVRDEKHLPGIQYVVIENYYKTYFSMIRRCSPRWRPSMINRQYQTSQKCWLAGSLALTPKNPNTRQRRSSLSTGL